jgi:starvation-inducible DNA-binding protein
MSVMQQSTTFRTRVGLRQEVRAPMIALLNQQLADMFDLYGQTKQAHWNVKGAEFFQIHLLFDKLAEEVEGYVDLLAERVTALGGTALGTVRMSAAASRLAEFPGDCLECTSSVDALATRYAGVASSTRTAIDTAAACGDSCSADLFTQVTRGLDSSLWFLEAHLQA